MKIIKIAVFLSMLISMLNADYFICNDYKRNLYAKVWQSDDQNKLILYNSKGRRVDTLYIGRAKAGNTRYYGRTTTIYIYKNNRQFSIRSYDSRRNRAGNIFGVFNCYAK